MVSRFLLALFAAVAGCVTSVLYASDMKSDPIHSNARGYRRIAETLAGLLRKSGAI